MTYYILYLLQVRKIMRIYFIYIYLYIIYIYFTYIYVYILYILIFFGYNSLQDKLFQLFQDM